VWSDWAKPMQLYILPGQAWLQMTDANCVRVQTPSTATLSLLLERLTAKLDHPQSPGRARSVKVFLGAQLCAPVVFPDVPGASFADLQVIARRHAAAYWGVEPKHGDAMIRCQLAAGVSGLAAAMPTGIWTDLHRWAEATNMTVTSLEPMWSSAMHANRHELASAHMVCVHEPDGTVVKLTMAERVAMAAEVDQMEWSAQSDHASVSASENKGIVRLEWTGALTHTDSSLGRPMRPASIIRRWLDRSAWAASSSMASTGFAVHAATLDGMAAGHSERPAANLAT
jgi:hypothetical protein